MMRVLSSLVFICLFLVACTEFQEPQLDDEKIEIFIPRDSLVTELSSQLFYWYEVDGALDYEFQIAQPNFEQINRLVVDTIVTETKVRFTLAPGAYEWRVRAFNNSSATAYTLYRLYVDSTLDLSSQEVLLLSPADKDTTNKKNQILKWQSLYNAEYYTIDLAAGNSFGTILNSWSPVEPSQNINLDEEGNYLWRVRALNTTSLSPYSERSFFLDTTAPAKPQLISPSNGQSLSNASVNFQWLHYRMGGASIRDSIQLATDSLFLLIYADAEVRGTSLVVDTLSSGQYFWRLKSIDKAGNRSPFSSVRSFQIP
ncbi:fibronectin type III domain-containing protein [Croceimicrobium hydrocarbonivorans]|uniref:Fibronectin type-III domain-containing protein n=1 Tax=Croceimicrobium hydrocarbonivorans TaxID=2761580 RepID=A0A7H0VBX3_9FLAO|nr:hypothetical protein [Croceimicrobium hydrocarbonivorans]QNR23221.1 hypothetical protein H4K34_12655 [Croceimicrobium hydrocarbonivorans]